MQKGQPSLAQIPAESTEPPTRGKPDLKKTPKWTLQEEVRLRKLILSKAGLDSSKASLTDLELLGDPKVFPADNLYWRQIEADFSAAHAPGTGTPRSYRALYARYSKELLPRDAAALARRREQVASSLVASDLSASAEKPASTQSLCSEPSGRPSSDIAATAAGRGDAAPPIAADSAGRTDPRHDVAPVSPSRPSEASIFRLQSDATGPSSRDSTLETCQAVESSMATTSGSVAEVTAPQQAVPVANKPRLPPISTVTGLIHPAASTASRREYSLNPRALGTEQSLVARS